MRSILIFVVIVFQFSSANIAYAQFEPTEAELEFSHAWMKDVSERSPEEDVLLAAMFSLRDNRKGALEYFSMPMKSTDYKKIRLSLLAEYCLVEESAIEVCESSNFERQLQSIDADTLQPYLYSMVKMAKTKKDNDAFVFLGRAVETTSANDYFFDKVIFARKKLSSVGYPKDRINLAAEILSGVRSLYAFYLNVHSICKERSVVDDSWKQQCLLLGRRFENYGRKNSYQYAFSFAIQMDSLGKTPEEEKEREAILKRKIAFGELRDLASKKVEWWSNWALRSDKYYKDINDLGEVRAIGKAVEESE